VATEAELAERFPDVPRAMKHALVHETYQSFAEARIRDFLPLLVRHIVHDRLAADPEARPDS